MVAINYTSDQLKQINDLKTQVEQYCEARGVDPSAYTKYLNDGKALDPALLKDPAFEAYWRLSYLQLMEILNPSLVQSMQGEVGGIDFDKLYAKAGNDTNQFITNLVLDDPDLMAFAALSDNDPKTSAQAVFKELDSYLTKTGAADTGGGAAADQEPGPYVDTQARDLAQKLGIGGGMWDYITTSQEGFKNSEAGMINMLNDMDAQLGQWSEMLRTGQIDSKVFSANVDQMSSYRSAIIGFIDKLEDAASRQLELFSELIKSRDQEQMSINRNLANA